jgi:hypothetical protein
MRGDHPVGPLPGPPVPAPGAAPSRPGADGLRAQALELEAFLFAQALGAAGAGGASSAPSWARASGGGAGQESPFASMLRMEHARQLAASGGTGIAEGLVRSLAHGERGPDHETPGLGLSSRGSR